MKIYTKKGDKGETALFGGERVPKDALRIEAYGTVDELNSILGVIRSLQPAVAIDNILLKIQYQLFELGADLATPRKKINRHVPRIKKYHITRLEKFIDTVDSQLEPLKVFILPGGSVIASYLHFARTICRRAERFAVRLARYENIGGNIVVYLNRLSDLLFVLARSANKLEQFHETQWVHHKRN
jgi:cob(I)alamin adenosyltransferase